VYLIHFLVTDLEQRIRQLESDNHRLTDELLSMTARSDELASQAVELQSQLSTNDEALSDKARQLENDCHELRRKVRLDTFF
jgi:predicted  nucleic acid-binding Zn-ribbon protein